MAQDTGIEQLSTGVVFILIHLRSLDMIDSINCVNRNESWFVFERIQLVCFGYQIFFLD